MVANLAGLIFTRADGRPITKDMIHAQVEKALRGDSEIQISRYAKHSADSVAPSKRLGRSSQRAGGWTSTQVYKRYLDMNEDDIAAAFGTAQASQMATEMATKKRRVTGSSFVST